MTSPVTGPRVGRFQVVDALRFAMALIVALGHMGPFPVFEGTQKGDGFAWMFMATQSLLVFGMSAVIVFFIISGFCIHHPFSRRPDRPFPVARFYARRYLRILAPLIAVVCLFSLLIPGTPIFGDNSILWASALWSIVCEEIYYGLYPLIQKLRWRYGWAIVIVPATIAAGVSATHLWISGDITPGIITIAVLLFPVWLSGCYLAEWSQTAAGRVSGSTIWIWRGAAACTMWLAAAAHVATSGHPGQTALPTAVVFYFWMRAEILRSRQQEPHRYLVWAGGWSYSLYLVHPLVIAMVGPYSAGWFAGRGSWLLGLAAIFGASFAFFLLVERPSHRLARRISLFPRKIPISDPRQGLTD